MKVWTLTISQRNRDFTNQEQEIVKRLNFYNLNKLYRERNKVLGLLYNSSVRSEIKLLNFELHEINQLIENKTSQSKN